LHERLFHADPNWVTRLPPWEGAPVAVNTNTNNNITGGYIYSRAHQEFAPFSSNVPVKHCASPPLPLLHCKSKSAVISFPLQPLVHYRLAYRSPLKNSLAKSCQEACLTRIKDLSFPVLGL
jgi:hypothetical protein